MCEAKTISIEKIVPTECPIDKFNCINCKYYTCLGYQRHIGCYYDNTDEEYESNKLKKNESNKDTGRTSH